MKALQGNSKMFSNLVNSNKKARNNFVSSFLVPGAGVEPARFPTGV